MRNVYKNNIMTNKNYRYRVIKTDIRNLQICTQKTLEQVEYMFRNGMISERVYSSYCWLWRNSTFRYSNLHIQSQKEKSPYPRLTNNFLTI